MPSPRPVTKRQRTTIVFPEDLYAAMKDVAAAQDVSITHLVKQACRDYVYVARAATQRSA